MVVLLPLLRAARRASTSALAESSSRALNCASRDDELTSAMPLARASSLPDLVLVAAHVAGRGQSCRCS